MFNDEKLHDALNTLQMYLDAGYKVYLWDENNTESSIKLNKDSELKFAVLSPLQTSRNED